MKNDENTFEAKIRITNFYPNKDKLKEEISNYLSSNYNDVEYQIELETDKLLILNFTNKTEVANCLLRKLKLMKIENKNFPQLTTSLKVHIKNSISEQKKQNKEQGIGTGTESNLNKKSFTSRTNLGTKGNLANKRYNSSTSTIDANKYKNYNPSKDIHRSRAKIYESIFLDCGPYLDKYELEKEENRKNKAQWINKKGFNQFVGKSYILKNSNTIENYVNRDPSESPLVYNFRVNQKSKWVGKKNFYV